MSQLDAHAPALPGTPVLSDPAVLSRPPVLSGPPVLPELVRQILDGTTSRSYATTNPDGLPQTSVILVIRDGDRILFSTIKGRRKTTNMLRDSRVNLLVHRLPVEMSSSPYATISGTVELIEDPDASFHQVVYDRYMGGATPPPEPGAERLIVRLRPQQVYIPPW